MKAKRSFFSWLLNLLGNLEEAPTSLAQTYAVLAMMELAEATLRAMAEAWKLHLGKVSSHLSVASLGPPSPSEGMTAAKERATMGLLWAP